MVQNNFGTKKRVPDSNMSILQRLGIDEGVDYNKPLMDPMAMFRSPSQMAAAVAAAAASGNLPPGFLPPPPFSTATSTTTRSNSSECSSPDRFRTSAEGGGRPSSTKSAASDKSPALDEVPLAASMIKKHSASAASAAAKVASVEDDEDKKNNEPDLDVSEDKSEVAEDHHMEDADDVAEENNSSNQTRPASRRRTRSSSRKTGEVEAGDGEDSIKCETASSPTPSKSSDVDSHLQRSASTSPVAMAAVVASNLMTKEDPDVEATTPTTEDENKSKGQPDSAPSKAQQGSTNKKKPNSHPLAALQMLCDKTEKKGGHGQGGAQGQVKGGPGNGSSSVFGQGTTDPGAILAFSWACNQAVVNDSLLKCPFCDTPFISKGAYRHHLSKMHFVKEGGGVMASPDVKHLKSPAGSGGVGNTPTSASGSASDSKEENTQSKFQKYSQLAKQLSCGSSQP